MSTKELPPQYNPKEVEDKIYKLWEGSGVFNPDVCIKKGVAKKDAKTFSIALPPPNVTGTLHLGHAFEHTLQDIMTRYHRMKGERTLWVPGTDHAAIATQAKYEKELYKNDKKSRHDFSREDFFSQIHEFALKNQSQILSQLKKLGLSIDWSRLAFTLDEKRKLAVHTAFKTMYDDGLIYRGYRIVNWDPKGQTTISDDEIMHEEAEGMLYTFRYSKEFPIPVATTRPETKVGDVAVAVHPDDARYKKYIGKTYNIDFVGVPLEIKIIADKEIDPAYGTGAVGITPAHSMVDWEIAERHKLPFKKVVNEFARMENASDELNGKKTLEAREIIMEKLRSAGLLEKEEKIKNNIGKAERTGGIVEPLPKLQWFVDVNKPFVLKRSKMKGVKSGSSVTLKDVMRKTVEEGDVTIMPDHFKKIYEHWIEDLRDWCISRQILYGHRIPVWYKEKETYCGIAAPKENGWTQDEDTLDTWFSSALWTFSTLGWPDATEDLKNYHPTTVINPGYEILFTWVARMILMSGYLLGEIPFRLVCFHGMVRDKDGKKFSKSANTGIDPLEVINKYGTDALRMSLVVGIAPGSDVNFDLNKVKAYQHFANKIWNAARFVLMNTQDFNKDSKPELAPKDSEFLAELTKVKADVTQDMEQYRFYLAGEKLYHYFWHTFADKIIEASKSKLTNPDAAGKASAQYTLLEILGTCLKLIHPFMPFITEETWQKLEPDKLLMVEKW